MYRLLIVDDEKHVVKWLYELFAEKSELGLEIFTASSGKEALEILNMVRMDIVLSDIRMPGMTGLELITCVNENWPDAKTIFLTGYHDFDSAYKAIKADAVNYLLKTEDDEEIVAAVEKAIAAIVDDLRHKTIIKKALYADQMLDYMLQRDLLRELILNRISVSAEAFNEAFKKAHIEMNALKPAIMLLGQTDGRLDDFDVKQLHQNIMSLKQLTRQTLSKSFEYIVSDIDDSSVIWMFQPLSGVTGESEHNNFDWLNKYAMYIGEMLEPLQTVCLESTGMNISFFLNESPVTWPNAGREYQLLKQIAQAKTDSNVGRAIIYSTKTNMDKAELLRRDVEIVDRIKAYILNNLGDELSLLRLSQCVNYSPSYVSRVFKLLSGTNLSDYILETRINKAKEMLRSDTENIINISKKLSFNTPQYFSTVFKKMTGMTPNEFRTSNYRITKDGLYE